MLPRQLHRQARGRSDRRQHRNPRDRRLLHELEAGPPADEQNRIAQRRPPRQELRADQLIERIMPADVFADAVQMPCRIEESRRVKAAGPIEPGLGRPQRVRQLAKDKRIERRPTLFRPRRQRHANRLDRRLAADAAAGCGIEVPLQPTEIDGDLGPQIDADHVVVDFVDAGDLPVSRHDSLREEETDCEFAVVAGRPHRHGDGPVLAPAVHGAAEPDFERLLDGNQIGMLGPAGVIDSRDADLRHEFVVRFRRRDGHRVVDLGRATRDRQPPGLSGDSRIPQSPGPRSPP